MTPERATAYRRRRAGPAIRAGSAARPPPNANDGRSGLSRSPLSTPSRLASQRLYDITANGQVMGMPMAATSIPRGPAGATDQRSFGSSLRLLLRQPATGD